MKTLVTWWKAESALILGIVLALVSAGLIPGVWGKILGAVLPLLGAGAVRQTVWAPDTVAQTVQNTATSVVSKLGPDTVGVVGNVTAAGNKVINGVVNDVLGTAMGSNVPGS